MINQKKSIHIIKFFFLWNRIDKTILLQMRDEEVGQISVYLKRNDTAYSFWYLINGPIADVLTHVGQIASWRRIAGNPIARISPFTGEVY